MNDEKIIGIDPGLDTIGWGILRKCGQNLSLEDCGIVKTSSRLPLEARLEKIYRQILNLISTHQPSECAIEEIYLTKKTPTHSNTLQARGVILLACKTSGLPIYPYNPGTIKKTVTGSGKAAKYHVQKFVQLRLNLKKLPVPDDAADALAAALCHLQISTINRKIEEYKKKLMLRREEKKKEFARVLKKAIKSK